MTGLLKQSEAGRLQVPIVPQAALQHAKMCDWHSQLRKNREVVKKKHVRHIARVVESFIISWNAK